MVVTFESKAINEIGRDHVIMSLELLNKSINSNDGIRIEDDTITFMIQVPMKMTAVFGHWLQANASTLAEAHQRAE